MPIFRRDYFPEVMFEQFSAYIHDNYGINYQKAKKDILETKLRKVMEKENIKSYKEYLRLLSDRNNDDIINDFISEITVNKTDFFRENSHFDFIKTNADRIMQRNPRLIKNGEIRVWCAGCATGEEAYTLAMILKESFPELRIKLLATDIDTVVLKKAMKGEYKDQDMERYYMDKYFMKTQSEIAVRPVLKDLITFRQFNLMNDFPFKNRFDIIFCRNVMIYFDAAMQQELLVKFYHSLVPGGLLFLGHTEGILNKKLNFQYVMPAIYMKK